MPRAQVWQPQRCCNVQFHTYVKFSSRRNQFQKRQAWPELQTGTEAIHPNTTPQAPLGEPHATHPGQGGEPPSGSHPRHTREPSSKLGMGSQGWPETSAPTVIPHHLPRSGEVVPVPRGCLLGFTGLPHPIRGQNGFLGRTPDHLPRGGGEFLTPTSCPPIPCSPEAAFTSRGPTVASPLNLGTCYAQGLQKGRQGGWCRGPQEIWSRLENARDRASLYKLSGGRGRAAWFRPEGGGDECLVVGRSCKGEIKRPLA